MVVKLSPLVKTDYIAIVTLPARPQPKEFVVGTPIAEAEHPVLRVITVSFSTVGPIAAMPATNALLTPEKCHATKRYRTWGAIVVKLTIGIPPAGIVG